MWKFGRCAVPSLRSCHCVGDCPVCLCHHWVFQTSSRVALENIGGMPVSSMSKSSGKNQAVTFLALSIQTAVRIVLALRPCACKTTASRNNRLATCSKTLMGGLGSGPALRAEPPQTWAEVSGWQFAIFRLFIRAFGLVNGWLALRRVAYGWHAASTADSLLDTLGAAKLAVFLHLPKRKAQRLELGGGSGSLFLLLFYLVCSLGARAQI